VRRLTGRVAVAAPAEEAFGLFTARGERDWAPGWDPWFPAGVADDTVPGTVFTTEAHGATTVWTVTACEPGRSISYARVTPGDRAGTVAVVVTGGGDRSEAEVTYALTALTGAAEADLDAFARDYPAYLRSWEEAIANHLGRP
jgi:hypothetical protein